MEISIKKIKARKYELITFFLVLFLVGKYLSIKEQSKSFTRIIPLSESMYPTLQIGEEYVFRKVKGDTTLNRSDIVSFLVDTEEVYPEYKFNPDCVKLVSKENKCFKEKELNYSKRIIGIPKDKIVFTENGFSVNGIIYEKNKLESSVVQDINKKKLIDEKESVYFDFYYEKHDGVEYTISILKNRSTVKNRSGFIELKDNEYFLMGDNRNMSFDSRNFGVINKEKITNILKEK